MKLLEKTLKTENEKQQKEIRSMESKKSSNDEVITELSNKLATLDGKLQQLDSINTNIANIEKQNENILRGHMLKLSM